MTYTQTALTGRTGFRPFTALSRQIARDLEMREPAAGDIERNSLYMVLDGARVGLGLGTPALETLKHLIGYTRPDDWKDGRTPLAWPSNYTLAELAGVTESGIKARLRQLRTLGLIMPRDSAQGRRTGRRDDAGVISKAFGLDLSPLRIRYAELRALADAQTAQSRLFREGRQEIGRVRRMVGQALAQAADLRLTGTHWIALQDGIERVAAIAAAARAARDSDAYQAALDQLPEVEEQVSDTLDRFMFNDDLDGSGSKSAPSIHIQTNPDSISHVQAKRDCSSISRGHAPLEAKLPASPSNSTFKARPPELVEMFPTTAMYVNAERPSWADLHHAASRLRHDLGIRTGTWVDALDKLGPDGATVAIMITAERQARSEIRQTAGAYFAGMVVKAKRDELDLGRSLWGFRTERMAAH